MVKFFDICALLIVITLIASPLIVMSLGLVYSVENKQLNNFYKKDDLKNIDSYVSETCLIRNCDYEYYEKCEGRNCNEYYILYCEFKTLNITDKYVILYRKLNIDSALSNKIKYENTTNTCYLNTVTNNIMFDLELESKINKIDKIKKNKNDLLISMITFSSLFGFVILIYFVLWIIDKYYWKNKVSPHI
jgi:hypothetical protein